MAFPSSLVGLVFIVVLLWPGFVYTAILDRSRPWQRPSALRESITVISASLTATLVVGLLFGVARVVMPDHSPSVRHLLFGPPSYLHEHCVMVGGWAIGLVVIGVGGSAAVALLRTSGIASRIPGVRRIALVPLPSEMSSWWLAFSEYSTDDYTHRVTCTLDDGTAVEGVLHAYSREADESADRDLVLRGPLRRRKDGGDSFDELVGAGLMTVSARHIVTMMVSYEPVPTLQPPPGSNPSATGPSSGDGSSTSAQP